MKVWSAEGDAVAEYEWFVGVDWGSETHEVCALSAARKVAWRKAVEHDGAALAALADTLSEQCGGQVELVAVAIETTHGPVVELLLERGFHVYALNPKQLDRFRDRHSVAGAKDDARDAFVLADALSTDRACYRQLSVGAPLALELRELSRAADALKEQRLRLANQLRELMLRYFPQALLLSNAMLDRWVWDLLALAPDARRARQLRRAQIERVLKANRISRVGVNDVREVFSRADVVTANGVREGITERVLLLLPQLKLVDAQLRQLEKRLAHQLERLSEPEPGDESGQQCEHRDAEILLSLPGAGITVAATMLAEAAEPLANRDYDSLRALVGCAPVTKRTGLDGKSSRRRASRKTTDEPASRRPVPVMMRRACNPRLREAAYHWSRVAIQHDARARELYAAHRAHGQSHARALRSVTDQQLRMLVSMLRSHSLYDPGRRG